MKASFVSRTIMAVCATMLLAASVAKADVNVLIIGSEKDTSDRLWTYTSTAFSPAKIKTQLQNILDGAGLGTANVVIEDHYGSSGDKECFSLVHWFHWPYPAGSEVGRWQNLRGEAGTQWDYVVVIGDPFTMEQLPGLYAHGVAKISEEVAKGTNGAETVLLMPWPAATSQQTVDHYKEVVYRVGRSGGFKVAPAALARADAVAAGHAAAGLTPADDAGAYICAASIYSRIWNQSASSSSYVYNDTLADSVFTTVTNNTGAPQYSGKWSFLPTSVNDHDAFGAFNVKSRVLSVGKAGGSSTEDLIIAGCNNAINRAGIKGQYDPQFRFVNGREYYYENAGQNPSFGFNFPIEYADADLTLGNILSDDIYRTITISRQWHQYRIIPHRILLGSLLQNDPGMNVYPGGHMYSRGTAIGSYMVTLVSGRCPVNSTLAEVYPFKDYPYAAFDWMAQKVGYEMAWNVSTLQVRAPGFKVVPRRETIGFDFPSTATVEFLYQPRTNVTVTISSASSNITITPSTMTFTPENYNVKQQVSVMANPGAVPDTALSLVYNSTSADEVYNALYDEWTYRINRAPTANNGTLTAYSELESPVTLQGSDPNSEYLTGVIVDQPSNGTVTVNGPVAAYTSDPGYTGPDSFTFKMSDGVDLSANTATISVTVEGQRPFDFNLLNNPSAELSPFTDYGWVDVNGSWARSAGGVDGSYSFFNTKSWAQDLYQDVDVSRYAAAISNGGQQFKISGHGYPGNDRVDVIMTFRDAAGTVLSTYEWVGYNQNLWLSFEATRTAPVNTATIRVLLRTQNANGSVNDGKLDALSLEALGNEPVANAQSVRVLKDQPKTITLTGTDADGDALTYSVVDAPANGTLDDSALPEVIYTPNADYVGTDSFTFMANDGIVDSALGTISITVDATNAAPTANTGLDKTVTLSTGMPWTPADLSPAAWYDAADTNTITASNGKVSQWSDKSGNENHVTQATSTAQPTTGSRTLNGLNMFDFDGSDDELLDPTFPSLSSLNFSIFAVQQHDRIDVQLMTAWGLGRNTSTEGLFFHASYDSVFNLGCRFPENTSVSYAENTNVELLSYVKTGANSQQAWVNGLSKGVQTGAVTTFTTERLALGSRFSANYLDGGIGEFVVIPSAVPEEDRQMLEGYLAHKWGFEGNLPTNHSYKSAAPIQTGTSVVLDGSSVTDPDDDPLSQTWTIVSTPTGGTARFDNPNLLHPTVIFDTAGDYVLRITVDDGLETDSDEMTITVIAPTTVPSYSVTYDGNGADSGTAPAPQVKTHGVDLTLESNSGGLAKAFHSFGGWNTAAAGDGTAYPAGGTYSDNADVTLYAKWNLTVSTIPFVEDFEALAVGDLDGQNRWTASSTTVQSNRVYEGTQAATISGEGMMQQDLLPVQTNVWTDFRTQPVFLDGVPADLPADATAVLYFNTNGHPVVYNGATPTTVDAITVTTGQWVRVRIHSDYVAKTWDLHIDDTLAAEDLNFYTTTLSACSSFLVKGGGRMGATLDALAITLSEVPDTETTTTNGTPYTWLDSFGITNDYELADLGDPDGDGALTWQEYQAGTDPTNAMSVFRLTSATVGVGGDLELVWYGTTNSGVTTEFVVYRCTNLISGGWLPVSTNTRSATGTNTWSGSGAPGAAFYRIGM